jgi:hypothetical protein
MSLGFVLWAQALDNAGPDHLQVDGVEIGPDDSGRAGAIARVSNVVHRARNRASHGDVRRTDDGTDMVLEIPSLERDVAGRIAPMVCCGRIAAMRRDPAGVVDTVEQFAGHIGRSIGPAQRNAVLALIEEKKSADERRRLVLVSIAAVVVASFVFLVASRLPKHG